MPANEWRPRSPWPWQKPASVTGEKLGQFTMGRKINGRWQYRNMTDKERADFIDAMQSY